jgi:hypothetical protein
VIDIDRVFVGSKLKIERANKHIADLNTLLDRFKTDFCSFGIEKDANTGNDILTFERVDPLPYSIALIVGDAIHNLHTALDLMMYEIVADRTSKFPFFEKREELIGQTKSGKIETARPDIYDLIVNTIKPYRGGNDALYGLHDLDISDKHRLLIIVLGVIVFTVDAEDKDGNVIPIGYNARIRADGVIKRFSTSAERHIKNYTNTSLEIQFGPGQPFQGESVIPTLHQLSQLVSGVVKTIGELFIARMGT